MTTYTSRYAELGFYVNGEFYRFAGGEYRTESPEVIAVLDRLSDAARADGPDESAELTEETPKPAPKPRKAAGTSAK